MLRILAFLFVAWAVVPLAAAVRVQSGAGVSDLWRVEERLRAVDRTVQRYFHPPQGGRAEDCVFVLDAALPRGILQRTPRTSGMNFCFNPGDGDFLEDFEFTRQLYSVLIMSRIAPGGDGVAVEFFAPPWLVAALESHRAGAAGAERILLNNRYFPVLRYFAVRGKFPDFARMRRLEVFGLTRMERIWLGELSRVLLDAAAGVNRSGGRIDGRGLSDYLLLIASGRASEEEAFRASLEPRLLQLADRSALAGGAGWSELAPEMKLQNYLQEHAMNMAWNEYFPIPGAVLGARVSALRQLRFELLDDEGKPEGQLIQFSLAVFPEYLARNDANLEPMRWVAAAALAGLGRYGDERWRSRAAGLQKAFDALSGSGERVSASRKEAFLSALRAVDEEAALRIRYERVLDTLSLQSDELPPYYFMLSAVEKDSDWLTPEQSEFFNAVEREFLDD